MLRARVCVGLAFAVAMLVVQLLQQQTGSLNQREERHQAAMAQAVDYPKTDFARTERRSMHSVPSPWHLPGVLPPPASPAPPAPPPPPPPSAASLDSPPPTVAKTEARSYPGEPVYIVVGADRVHWPGVVGVINSLIANSGSPNRLRVLALCPAGLEHAFLKYLRCHGLSPSDSEASHLRIAGFSGSRVPPLRVQTKLTNLESPLNFARFYLAELLPPSATKVLYLDADVIVAGDAAALYDSALPNDELCAATLRKTTLGAKGVASLRGERLGARYRARYGKALPLQAHGFNAGVFVFNLRR